MAFAAPANNAGIPLPAIPADPPSLSDITRTKDYVERLILSKATHSEIHATDDEIGAAELYLHESVLKTSLGGAAAPPWLDVFVNTLNEVRQTVKRTSAVIENMRIAKYNVELAKSTGSTSYRAKQKEVDGDGTGLANIINTNQNPLAPLAAVPAVGAVFSATIETHNLNHNTILRIVQYYNEDFNIQPGDTVPIRTQKITNWLRSEM